MLRFLLDQNFSPDVVIAVQRLDPACEVISLYHWQGGIHVAAKDHDLLHQCAIEKLTFVIFDVSTIPAAIAILAARGESSIAPPRPTPITTTAPGRGRSWHFGAGKAMPAGRIGLAFSERNSWLRRRPTARKGQE